MSKGAFMVQTHKFSTREALEEQLCDRIVSLLRSAIEQRGEAALVVSGGRTPAGLFQRLSKASLDWDRVRVTLADERWVPADHEDSNARSVQTHLLQGKALAANFLPLFNDQPTPHQGQAELESVLRQLPETIDAVVLGMGEDGHTASFFPDAAELLQALDMDSGQSCIAVTPPAAPHLRMTLTLPRLLASRQIFLHLCGEAKIPVLEEAMAPGATEQMPVRSVLRQEQTPVDIYWAP